MQDILEVAPAAGKKPAHVETTDLVAWAKSRGIGRGELARRLVAEGVLPDTDPAAPRTNQLVESFDAWDAWVKAGRDLKQYSDAMHAAEEAVATWENRLKAFY